MNHHHFTAARELWEQGQASRPTTSPTTLPLTDIHAMPEVFQPRNEDSRFEQHDHVHALTRAIQQHGKPTEPIVVLWLGQRYVIVDGHHRYLAYSGCKVTHPELVKSIPISEFQGTLDEAIWHSLEENKKTKLSMTKTERVESAWQMFLAGPELYVSQRKLAARCGVGVGQPTAFKKAVEEMKELDLPYETYSWKEVLDAKRGHVEYDEEWLDMQEEVWCRRIEKHFGSELKRYPDRFAGALMKRLGESAFERQVECMMECSSKYVDCIDFGDIDF